MRDDSCLGKGETLAEVEFLDLIRYGDADGLRAFAEDTAKAVAVQNNWPFLRRCVKEVIGTANVILME